MKLKSSAISYNCKDMRVTNGGLLFTLTQEPVKMSGMVTLESDDGMELRSLISEDYEFQYIKTLYNDTWSIEFTHIEYIPPAPVPPPEPPPPDPRAAQFDLMWKVLGDDMGEVLTADEVIQNETAFPIWEV